MATSKDNTINNKVSILMKEKDISSEDAPIRGSKLQEHDFFDHTKNTAIGSSSLSMANNKSNNEENIKKVSSSNFSCNFCKRQFSTPQALGGHQNAHKQERELAKHRKDQVNNGVGIPRYPSPYYTNYPSPSRIPRYPSPYYTNYPSPSTTPYHGFRFGPYNRALGVNTGSMIHKTMSNYSWTSPLFKSFSTPKPEMKNFFSNEGLKNEDLYVNNGNNVTPTLRNMLNLDEVGKYSINIEAKSKSKSKSTEDDSIVVGTNADYHGTNIEEVSDSKSFELDLSLKL